MIPRLILAAALVAALAPAVRAQTPSTPPAAPPAPALSEAQRLKAPLLAAQMEAAENAIALGQAKLAILKRAALDLQQEYLETVKAPAGSTWDFSRMVAIPPPSPPAAPPKS